jgi:hypothetical protein
VLLDLVRRGAAPPDVHLDQRVGDVAWGTA